MATIRCNYKTKDICATFPLMEIASSDNETGANRIFLSRTHRSTLAIDWSPITWPSIRVRLSQRSNRSSCVLRFLETSDVDELLWFLFEKIQHSKAFNKGKRERLDDRYSKNYFCAFFRSNLVKHGPITPWRRKTTGCSIYRWITDIYCWSVDTNAWWLIEPFTGDAGTSFSSSEALSTLATDRRNFISLVSLGMNSRGMRNEARLNRSIKIL